MIDIKMTGSLDGVDILVRSLQGIEERANDLTPAYPEVIRIARGFFKEAMDTEGASTDFGPWKKLSASTQAERRREGYNPQGPILQRSQRLYRSVTSDSAGGFTVQTPSYLAVGSDDPHIAFHQSTRPRTKIPRRPIASFTADQKTQLFRPFRLYLTGYDPATPQRAPRRGVGQ